MRAISRFGYIIESIAPPMHDDVLVVYGGAIVTVTTYVGYKCFFSLASLLALSFESMSSQDLHPTQLPPLIRQKQKKRNFILPVPSSWTKLNVQSRAKIHGKELQYLDDSNN